MQKRYGFGPRETPWYLVRERLRNSLIKMNAHSLMGQASTDDLPVDGSHHTCIDKAPNSGFDKQCPDVENSIWASAGCVEVKDR